MEAKKYFTSSWGIITAGLILGSLAALLSVFGNPQNMGLCIACFTRDLAGAIGVHRVQSVQYLRPELLGIMIGAAFAALISGEFSAKGGSAPFVRFILGIFAMIASLVFLGCPWRMLLRLAGGDINAIFGLLGLIVGGGIGIIFWSRGYSLGKAQKIPFLLGLLPLIISVGLLLLLLTRAQFGEGFALFWSTSGPGSKHAPIFIALAFSLVIGFIAQKSRFCTVGGIRDAVFCKDFHMAKGVIAFVTAAFLINLATNRLQFSMQNQPIAHTNILWNFLSMLLASLAFTLGFGCPGRQFVLSAEGNTDAFIFILGMVFGAGIAHNFNLASSVNGPTVYGMWAVGIGMLVCVCIGAVMSKKATA